MSARTFFASVLVLACASAVQAASVTYTSEAAFTAAAPGLTMESFETSFASGLNQSFTGFTVTKSGGSNLVSDTIYPTDGLRTLTTLSWSNGQTITFTFAAAINAFGFNIRDYGTAGTPSSISLSTNAPENLGVILSAASSQPIGNTQEFGMISSGTFTTVALSFSGGTGDAVDFDEVRFGTVQSGGGPSAVPLPASAWGGIALGGLLALRVIRNKLRKGPAA